MATLSDIRTELDAYVDRTDTPYTSRRDALINRGLRRVQRKLLTAVGSRAVWQNTANFVVGTTAILIPTDYRPSGETTLFYLAGTTRKPIRRIAYEWLYAPFRDVAAQATIDLRDPTAQGVPAYFAIRGRTLEIRPASNLLRTLELHGLGYFPALVADGDSNLLTVEAEDLTLYAALWACWHFFEDLGRSTYWWEQAKDAALDWMKDRVHEESTDRLLVMETPG